MTQIAAHNLVTLPSTGFIRKYVQTNPTFLLTHKKAKS